MTSVLVTGAGRGIGLAITDRAAVVRLHGQLPSQLDGVVNNAGIIVQGPVETVPLDDLSRQLEVNVTAQIAVVRAVLPQLREARGRVIFMSSVRGLITLPGTGAYSASKYALESLADALRMELRPWRIPVSLIEPGPTRTDMWGGAIDDYDRMTSQLSPAHRELYASHSRAIPRRSLRPSIALSRPDTRSVATGATTSAALSLHSCRRPRQPSPTRCSLAPPNPEEFSVNDNSNETVITSYAQAPTRTVTVGGTTYAYRELGPKGGIPVVFFVHLAATLDNWDPRIVDPIAQNRHVVAFDQRGVGASTGQVPNTLEEAADHAYEFIAALGFGRIDVFSFSMGGMIAQDLTVKHPDLVRRLVLTGTGPRGGKDMDKVVGVTYWDILRATLTRSDPKEFLFFSRDATGKSAAKAFVKRLQERTLDRDQDISIKALRTQLKAIQKFGRSAPSDLSTFTQPTLIANGDHDRMVPTVLSEDLHRRIKGSELIIYPNSGHGGIFQFHDRFAPVAVDFLGASA